MERIEVKNFLAIKEADIEVKKIVVLIGEQASGKSTLAKLIYFFKSLKDDLFSQIYKAETSEFNTTNDLVFPIRNKFYDFFGSTLHLSNFQIIYYYKDSQYVSDRKYIKLELDERKKLKVDVSHFLNGEIKTSLNSIKRILFNDSNTDISEQLVFDENKLNHAKRLSTLINTLFENSQNNSLYVIAGRNATVSYSELFEKYLFAATQLKLEEQSKLSDKNRFKSFDTTVDENLMLKFIERITKHKETFKKLGNFEGLIESYSDNKTYTRQNLNSVKEKIDQILKGEYSIDNFGEKIILDKTLNKYIYLSNASSGQQESVRILQDIFLNILNGYKLLRIIEEPESHLFPTAQKHLLELLALMNNQNVENQLIITTHSPYVLTVLNNLLFAHRVVNKNASLRDDVNAILLEKYWLDANYFSAYSLKTQEYDSEIYCESLMSDIQLINQNYLDLVSETLSLEYNALYKLHAQTFSRK